LEQVHRKIRKRVIELSKKYKVNIKNNKNIKHNKTLGKHNKTLSKHNNNQKDNIEPEKKENNLNIEDKQNIIKNNILEFDEKINDNNNLNIGMNSIDNVTFLKQKTTHKESLVSFNQEEICIENKNKSSIQNLLSFNNINNNNLLNKCRTTKDMSNQNNIKSKSIESQCPNSDNGYKEKLINDQNQKNIINDTLKQSTIYQNFQFCEDSNKIDESINSKNSILKKVNNSNKSILIKNEKIYYNAFINLIMTKEKYFNLNSSYDNINEISNNKYIKSSELQLKTKIFIKNESEKIKDITKKDIFLKVPGTPKDQKIISKKSFNKSNFGTYISDKYLDKNSLLSQEKSNNEIQTFNKLMTMDLQHKDKNGEGYMADFNQNKFGFSANKLFEVKKIENHSSSKIFDINKNGLMESPKKRRRTEKIKRNSIILNKKLNLITKNIQKTSKIINNPEEFYIDMFNNIIQKEKSNGKKEKEDENSTILNCNSVERNNKNTISDKI
jgi:hypothetical protein